MITYTRSQTNTHIFVKEPSSYKGSNFCPNEKFLRLSAGGVFTKGILRLSVETVTFCRRLLKLLASAGGVFTKGILMEVFLLEATETYCQRIFAGGIVLIDVSHKLYLSVGEQ